MFQKHRWLLPLLIGLCVLVAALLFLTLRPGPKPAYGVNLLKNADFEVRDEAGMPRDWLSDAYARGSSYSSFASAEGREGKGALVRNLLNNDARFVQTVQVLPKTLYELSGYINAKVPDGRGANLSVGEVYGPNTGIHDTHGEWKRFTVYGRTVDGQKELKVYLRVGGYSADSQGEAVFDDVSFKAIERLPAGAEQESWEPWKPAPKPVEPVGPGPAWPMLVAVALAYLGLALFLVYQLEIRQREPQLKEPRGPWSGALLALLAVTLITRVLLALKVHGYGVDISCFTGWANQMAKVGPVNFYVSDIYSDYPPGYMLVLWPIGLLGRILGGGASSFLVKLPAILTDLFSVLVLYRFASRRMKQAPALLLSALYAVNPLVYVTGAAWGQVDSVPAFLILLVLLDAMEGKWARALPVYVLSVLMKPQALMFGPLGLAALVLYLVQQRDKQRWKQLWMGLLFSLLTAVAVILPFSIKQGGLGWLIKLYGGTMNLYAYATVNATNLYFLFGQNWVGVSGGAGFLLRLVGALCLIMPTAYYLYRSQLPSWMGGGKGVLPSRRERLLMLLSLLPTLPVLVLPMPLSLMGTLLMASGFLLVLCAFVLRGSSRNLPLLGGVLLILFCELGVMMHERYLFPALLILLLAYAIRRDRSILWLLLGLSLLTFLNVGIVLDRGIRIGGAAGHLSSPIAGIDSDSEALEYLIAALHSLMAAFALYIGLTQSREDLALRPAFSGRMRDVAGKPLPDAGEDPALLRLLRPRAYEPMRAKEWALVALVTILYGVLALTNLGTTVSPQSAWKTTKPSEEAVFDLGSSRQFKLLYYAGIHWSGSDFEVEVSEDQQSWVTKPAEMDYGQCFSWRYQTEKRQDDSGKYTGLKVDHEGRYLRIRTKQPDSTIYEIIARDAQTGENIPMRLISGDAAALIDEQHVLEGEPSWFNSMYFDEIFHARTGLEQANAMRGLEPSAIYEVSHPPLGKVLISFAIMAFGMNPFGWRFAGAMAGVLMLPGMYLLGRRLTGRKLYGLAAMLLMAFDCMHFAQTRIATIDSFVTLFIIWSYYFMFRFALDDSYAMPFRKSLPDLFLSGLFMGLGMASKWTGVYAGLGLAVIFFIALFRRVMEGLAADRRLKDQPWDDWAQGLPGERMPVLLAARDQWLGRSIKTLLWCIPFFVVIPLLIYYLSFIPVFMQTPGGITVRKVLDANAYMLGYHAKPGLGMDHPYYSAWYTWPLILKPMWFYSGARINGTGSSIVSFGNPAVWWGGLLALVFCAGWLLKQRLGDRRLAPKDGPGDDVRPLYLLLAFMAQYLPWVLVPRGTYIYHYFPSVPFIILCAVLMLHYLRGRRPKLGFWLTIGYVALAGLLFVAFFPFASGIRVPFEWFNAMQWFPGWLLY